MIELKGDPGRARLYGLTTQALFAVMVGHEIWKAEGRTLVWTSGAEGAHAGRTRGHARGMSVDFRTIEQRPGIDGLPPGRVPAVVAALIAALGPDYQVLHETGPDHIHVEWLPLDIEPRG